MVQQALKTIRRYGMFQPGETVLVAVSGGPDSIALLHLLLELNPRLCLKISVAHLDHNLRKDSAKDLLFVKQCAARLKVGFCSGVVSWKGASKKAASEDLLREVRYGFLFDTARRLGARKIVLGHTQDDQAETVLMRILRGSGLYGLSAILPKRSLRGIEIVRPLIEVSRDDVLCYLKAKKARFRMDPTNSKDIYARNKIRKDLLPLLEKNYNPNIKDVLSGLALSVGADYEYLRLVAEGFLKKHLSKGAGRRRIDLAALMRLDISLRRLVLRLAVGDIEGEGPRPSFKHWQEVEDMLVSGPPGAQTHLPGFVVVAKAGNHLDIKKQSCF